MATREETKRMIEVMQAYVEGKDIQRERHGEWMDWDEPSWCWTNLNYRVKPKEPRRVWVNFYRDGSTGTAHRSIAECVESRVSDFTASAVEFVEVMPDDT